MPMGGEGKAVATAETCGVNEVVFLRYMDSEVAYGPALLKGPRASSGGTAPTGSPP